MPLRLNNIRHLILISLICVLTILSIVSFFISGYWWIILFFIIWTLLIFIFFLLLLSLFQYLLEKKKIEPKPEMSKFKRIQFVLPIIVLLVLMSVCSYSMILSPVSHLKSEMNQNELHYIVNDIVDNNMDDETKTKAILEWFDSSNHNIFNNYQLFKQGKLLYRVTDKMVKLYSCPPYIGVRSFNDKDSLWILTTQFGHCGEYALIFRDIAEDAGLKVRLVKCSGEDHVWNEVLINGEWVIVDTTAVHLPNRTGYNLSSDFMEKKVAGDLNSSVGNISYISGEYSNGTKVDITYRYSNVTRVNVQVIDSNGNPLSNVGIWIISNNRLISRDTNLKNYTNDDGLCSFLMGGGNITLKAKSKDFIPEYGEKTFIFNESGIHNITIRMKNDWAKNECLLFIAICGSIILIGIPIYYLLKKFRN